MLEERRKRNVSTREKEKIKEKIAAKLLQRRDKRRARKIEGKGRKA